VRIILAPNREVCVVRIILTPNREVCCEDNIGT
jgi:hypothetical protein